MSKIASFFRIPPALLNEIKANPGDIYDIFDNSDDIQELELDIDQSWQGIYFLLTGEKVQDTIPDNIGKAVLGGTPVGDDFAGNGPVRYFEPDEVQEIYNELKEIPASKLAERYDTEALSANNIYPMGRRWSEDDQDYLIENYDFLLNYYQTAAENNQAMLLVIS